MTTLPTRADVEEAAARIAGRLPRTPLLPGRSLGAQLKCELFQRTGSFKARGALNRVLQLTPEERARGVIAISAGNHAAAIAFAAAEVGVDALVVMWQGASEQKIEATRRYGGTVDLAATDPAGAFDRLHALIAETGRVLVHPFDDPVVIAGAGTVGLEIEQDAPEADAVVVAVGGGGLVSGIQTALAGRMRVIAVEPERSRALYDGLAAGSAVRVACDSIADGLNAPFAGGIAIEVCHDIERVLVTEEEITAAFRLLHERAKLAVEPAGATALAAVIAGKVDAKAPVVVVSGGNVARTTASAILAAR